MTADIGAVILARALPVREDVVARVPDLVLLCVVDPSEPPVYHCAGAGFHVG